jgi:hypothetical protein
MNRRTVIIVGVIIALALVAIFLSRPSNNKRQSNKSPMDKIVAAPKVSSQIPNAPEKISLDNLASRTLPKVFPSYIVSVPILLALNEEQIQQIANAFSFSPAEGSKTIYGNSKVYTYENSSGRVLSVTDDPPAVDFSELPGESGSKTPPTLEKAKTLSSNLVNAIQPRLPSGWEIKVVGSVYLKGGGSSASEVRTAEEAGLTNVSLGYFYKGYAVLNSQGKLIFFNFIFGPGGSVVSAKAQFLLNNLDLVAGPPIEVPTKNLEEVVAAFFNGEPRAIFMGLANTISDEPITNPPTAVTASDLQAVLVLMDNNLLPYYLISSSGKFPSGRQGEVLYLVPAAKNK